MKTKLETANGVFFVKSNKQIVESLFEGPKTASGTYIVKKRGILFKDLKGEPFAYLCANNEYSPFFVSCCYNNPPKDKRIRYMFSCTDKTEEMLGIKGMRHIDERELALKIWKEFRKFPCAAT